MLCCRSSPSDFHSSLATSCNSSLRFRQIILVDFKSDKFFNPTLLRCHRRITDAEKGIQHGQDARRSVQSDAPLGELNGKRRGMRPFFLATLNRFIGDEPRVAPATQIFSKSMRPSRDVALILIRNAKCQPIQFDATGLREMKNVFMAII